MMMKERKKEKKKLSYGVNLMVQQKKKNDFV